MCPYSAVAFFSDQAMLPGLHVALLSLLEAIGDGEPLEVHLFLDRVKAGDKALLIETAKRVNKNAGINIQDAVSPEILGANGLHGNKTVYGRVFLAELLPQYSRVLYLDSDVIVIKSVREWIAGREQQATIYADGMTPRATSADRALFQNAGLDMSRTSFNSGAMIIDLDRWRAQNRTVECLATAKRFPGEFRCADQSLLNVVFHDDFVAVGSRINHPLYPSEPPLSLAQNDSTILHFVGSPKPWDPLGKYLHNNYFLWRHFYERTAMAGRSTLRYASPWRTLRTSRSTFRAWQDIRRRRAASNGI